MMTWLKNLFAQSREAVDDSAFGAIILVLGFVSGSLWATIHHPELWNPLTYGGGAAGLASGIGAMYRLRKDT